MWLFFLLKSRWWKENRRPPKTGTPRGDAAVSEQQSAELEETLRPQRSVGFVLISTIFVQVDARPAHWVAVGKKLDKTIKKKPASPHTHTMADSWWRSRISFHDNNKKSNLGVCPAQGEQTGVVVVAGKLREWLNIFSCGHGFLYTPTVQVGVSRHNVCMNNYTFKWIRVKKNKKVKGDR